MASECYVARLDPSLLLGTASDYASAVRSNAMRSARANLPGTAGVGVAVGVGGSNEVANAAYEGNCDYVSD